MLVRYHVALDLTSKATMRWREQCKSWCNYLDMSALTLHLNVVFDFFAIYQAWFSIPGYGSL